MLTIQPCSKEHYTTKLVDSPLNFKSAGNGESFKVSGGTFFARTGNSYWELTSNKNMSHGHIMTEIHLYNRAESTEYV